VLIELESRVIVANCETLPRLRGDPPPHRAVAKLIAEAMATLNAALEAAEHPASFCPRVFANGLNGM
jgi:hypothetical protein